MNDMQKKLGHYFSYPLYEGNIATIIAPSLILSLFIFLSQKFASLLGSYGVIPGLLLSIAIICFSMDYLRQIVKSAAKGETQPPEWNIDRIDLEEMFRGVIPLAVSSFEIFFIIIPVNFLISLSMDTAFWNQFVISWKLQVLMPFVVLYPVNLLSYSIFDDFIIVRLFRTLSKTALLKIFTIHTLSFYVLIHVILLPIWKNFFMILLSFGILFYLFQIWGYSLGCIYYRDVNFLDEG
jgi:hypothetical protein